MSITNTKAKSVYNANGTTTEWNLGFTYNDTVSNVHIYIVDANDNETEVTSNYSIADGVLTYPTTASGLAPLAEGNKLVIVRDTPRTQDIELTSNGKLEGKVLEGGYDKLTLQVQELTEQVNRAVKIPVTEDSADNFLDPITAITEAKKEALVEIAQATTPAEMAKDTAVAKAQVATEQATIATNAATSAKAAQVGAEQAEQNATAQAEKAEKAVTAFVEGLGTAKNAVIDLGTFDGKTSVTSSRIIEFSKTPIAVSLRFSDTNKKLWINGTNSTVGIEVIDNTHCNLFYSIASADFVGQNAVKGPFVVQAIIQYSLLDNSATETETGAVKLATKAEAEAGTNDTNAMTPLKTKYAIESNATVQTLRNDIDGIGDQVAGIEAKIPINAYTEANLLAGNGIEIVDEPVEGGIDNHTLACWHFDEGLEPIKFDSQLTSDVRGTIEQDYYKFGNGSCSGPNITIMNHGLNTSDFTVDYFFMPKDYLGGQNTYIGDVRIYINGLGIIVYFNNNKIYEFSIEQYGIWTHFAIQRKDLIYTIYVNGQSVFQSTEALTTRPATLFKAATGGSIYFYIDELRISDIARPLTPDGKFPVPTKPYSIAEPTGNKVVNNTITKTSQLTNDSGFITDMPVATTSTLGVVKPDGTTITATEDGVISATGGSGSGSGFDFEGTKAEFDAAVAAGTITEDSVSLITDDVSGDNVATKAELQYRVSKSGDTMSGTLVMENGSNGIRFNGSTSDNFYYVKGQDPFISISNKNNQGIFIPIEHNGQPYYYDNANSWRLLTTADLSSNTGSTIQGAINYSAQVTITSPFTCPTGGAIGFRCGSGDWNTLDLKINNIQVFYRDGGEYRGASQSMFATVSAGDVISWTGAPSASLFWPAK